MTSSEQSIMQGIMRKHGYDRLTKSYSASDIKKLDPREHVRRRPGMYVGGTGKKALHYILLELIGRARISASIQRCENLTITFHEDNFVTLDDTDSIIPELFATGDFYSFRNEQKDLRGGFPDLLWYQMPVFTADGGHLTFSGLDHINLDRVIPLCSFISIMLRHNNQVWTCDYREGKLNGAMQTYKLNTPKPEGVTIHFQPDFTIFEPNGFDYDWIAQRCQEITYLMPAMTITLIDEREGQAKQDLFHYPDGIQAMVRDLNQGHSPHHDLLYKREVVTLADRNQNPYDVIVEVAIQYTDSEASTVRGYVNSVLSENGGTHVDALRHALMGYINGANPHPQSWEDISQGLTAIINIWHPYPEYAFIQDIIKFLNPDVFDVVESLLYPLFTQHNLRKLRQENKDS